MTERLVTITVSDGSVEKELVRINRGSNGDIYIHPAASKTKQGAHVSIHASGEIHVRYYGMKRKSILNNVGELNKFKGCQVVTGYYLDRVLFEYLTKKCKPEPDVQRIVVDLSKVLWGRYLVVHVAIVSDADVNDLEKIASRHENHSPVQFCRKTQPLIGVFYYWQ